MSRAPIAGDAAPAQARARATTARAAVRAPAATRIAPDIWLVLALTAIAALLRFSTITTQSFWADEAATVHEVGLSFGAMLHTLRLEETTPPLYFSLAWVWTRVFGAGELGIRSLSALLGVALVPVAYLCGRELVTRAAGVVAAVLTAFSPYMIWYSQEARSYMLLALVSALSLLYCARAARTHRAVDLVLWALASALAILTHFFAGFLIAPEALFLLWAVRSRGAVLACAAVAVAQAGVAPLAVSDTSHPLSWIQGFPLSLRIEQIPVEFAFSGLRYDGSILAYGLRGALVLAVVAVALIALGGGPAERRGAALAGAAGAFVILAPLALTQLGSDYLVARNLTPAWIPLAVALGAACTAPRARIAGGLLAAVLIAAFIWAGSTVAGDPAYQRKDWRAVAAALGSPTGPRAIVAYGGNEAGEPLAVYLPRTEFSYNGLPSSPAPVAIVELDIVGNDYASLRSPLPAGVRVISSKVVGPFLVERLRLEVRLTPSEFGNTARYLLFPYPPGRAAVLLQR